MKNILKTGILFLSLLSFGGCKKDKDLVEVTIPEPEKAVSQQVGDPDDVKAEDPDGPFQMIPLPYAYNALEPFIDAKTMEIHYSKHHVNYCNKLNAAVKGTELENKNIEEILAKLDPKNSDVRNNGGGYYNHNLFFEILGQNATEPTDEIAEKITLDFGSFDEFKKQFSEKANKIFGSGWVWLIVDTNGKLAITTTTNQDNPLMPNAEQKGKPILALDVWEHAYYLKYQNKRKDYIEAFYNVINWKKVNEKFNEIKPKTE
ncbi:superoxide dismutase [Flavobacterium sp. 20NA77.7]|uniref:Superoxide dismutase n=1 Tax=Flavobacterium nakdongensis TaxID=3073563 RepID=A0ABY9RDQ4_9FLAO|nr:superoxide dismutase [Flavobacterium sp. 20NA77.7]WMW78445.1 superoxide dismutase [Flavobacterium sp. 20NA77.7]